MTFGGSEIGISALTHDTPLRGLTKMNDPLHENLCTLGFHPTWIELGLITPDSLEALVREFHTGNDPHPEHWRFRVFRDYVAANRPLPHDVAEALFDLAETDPALEAAIKTDLLDFRECPDVLLDRALASGDRHLARTAQRCRLLDAAAAGITEPLFEAILAGNDVYVQRAVLDRGMALTREQLDHLAAEGANRMVRNIAKAHLRRTMYRDPVAG